MVDNLFRRLAQIARLDDVAGPILQEIAQRVRLADTVVRRFAGPEASGRTRPADLLGCPASPVRRLSLTTPN